MLASRYEPRPPLLACRHAVCARLLLEDSADPLVANARGDTALHLAAGRGHAACLDMLLRSWVRNPGSGATVRAADALISDGLGEERYVDTHNRAGLAALHLAVLGGSVESGWLGRPYQCLQEGSPKERSSMVATEGLDLKGASG